MIYVGYTNPKVKNIADPSKATANDTGDPDYSLAFLKQEIDSEGRHYEEWPTPYSRISLLMKF